jgi:hypothetical protein
MAMYSQGANADSGDGQGVRLFQRSSRSPLDVSRIRCHASPTRIAFAHRSIYASSTFVVIATIPAASSS